jgi:hypothetical protein
LYGLCRGGFSKETAFLFQTDEIIFLGKKPLWALKPTAKYDSRPGVMKMSESTLTKTPIVPVEAEASSPNIVVSDKPTGRHVLLGPFIADVTASSAKVWLYKSGIAPSQTECITVTLHRGSIEAEEIQHREVHLSYEDFGVGIIQFEALHPDTLYYYRLWQNYPQHIPVDLQGLNHTDLYFRTLPEHGFDEQLDFLLMSCHNPETASDDHFDGFAVWARIPEIIQENKNVRFCILCGDQVYGDDLEGQILTEYRTDSEEMKDQTKRLRRSQQLYLGIYERFWNNIHYRKVLCSLPAILMWDDHDITDGWGSREDSFEDKSASEFKPEWKALFTVAKSVFERMQASRNPAPPVLHYPYGFDTCFRIGSAGFAVADLRSNRNVRKRRLWLPEQLEAIKQWVHTHKEGMHTFFFVSPVVFSHGALQIDNLILRYSVKFLFLIHWMRRFGRFIKSVRRLSESLSFNVGDLRDDINDSWGAEINRAEADRVLDFLFGLQNPSDGSNPIRVVILSGDIHTPGYSTIFSADPAHQRAVIPHIVASPVAYKPFSWIGEAILRHLTRVVNIGHKGTYSAQISHHFCYRNVVLVSLRNYKEDESFLKVKYYLEGFPEPQTAIFDLERGSHRETIAWNPQEAGHAVSLPPS